MARHFHNGWVDRRYNLERHLIEQPDDQCARTALRKLGPPPRFTHFDAPAPIDLSSEEFQRMKRKFLDDLKHASRPLTPLPRIKD